jgi:hypothetical protein
MESDNNDSVEPGVLRDPRFLMPFLFLATRQLSIE